jgi:hypothetical protein
MSGDEFARRFEVVAETRRRWSREEKLAIATLKRLISALDA